MAEPALRRHGDQLLTLFVGIIVGALTAFATFASRVAALEVRAENSAAQIRELQTAQEDESRYVRSIAEKLGATPGTLSYRPPEGIR